MDDVIENSNHFRCIDMVIDQAGSALTEKFIKELHFVLKTGTSDSRKNWFAVGEYKKLPNEVGGNDTTVYCPPMTYSFLSIAYRQSFVNNRKNKITLAFYHKRMYNTFEN